MLKESMVDHKVENYILNAKLCKLVESHPCMYDRSSPNYLRKEFVENAWADISLQLNDTVASCRERWRNIRTAYARSVNIYKSPSGPNRHKLYYLHDELQFLTKHLAQGLPSIRVLTPNELDTNHENSRQSVENSDDNDLNEIITLDSPVSSVQDRATEEEPVEEPEAEKELESESAQEAEKEQETAIDQETYKEPNNINKDRPTTMSAKKRCRKNSEDIPIASKLPKRDLDIEFVNIILPEIKNMNARQKVLFKAKIFEALEEVLSDPKDFPRRDSPIPSQNIYINPGSERSLSNKVNEKTVKVCRSQKQVEEPIDGGVPRPMQEVLIQPQNGYVKQEFESENEYH